MSETHEVLIRLPRTLTALIGDQENVTVALAVGSTVEGLLDELAEAYPILDRRLRDETGAIRRYVNLYLDGEDIRNLDGEKTVIGAGQDVQVIQSVAGG
ncbi:MoaD/ThiS family protein [Saxibacter everestensis]|uniref:MoaD/ThiS family protein n=1 Tax=Saxibacter everestensis TaxID=2909229 RepID=A0ABY8QXK1_9MICO|nr:MoaD/ThiS family protein [Brevibacteriaceae bacterium ZFBP1038]